MLRVGSETQRTRINYTAADVGVLTAPDKLPKFRTLTDYEMEMKFQKLNKSIDSKRVSFEDRKKTPFLLKYVLIITGVYALWKSIKK